MEARKRIEQFFGSETPVVLEVFHDPEGESEPELFALIQAKLPADEARKRRSQLDKEWWVENSVHGRCRLNIDLEYR